MSEFEVVMLFLSSILCFYLLRLLHKVWWTPTRLQANMRSQGIGGPPYKFPHGDTMQISHMRSQFMIMDKPILDSNDISHHLFPRIQPHVYAWTKAYGKNFFCWHGSKCRLFVTEPELVKEVLMNREGAFPKLDLEGYSKKLLGESLVSNEGESWAKVRKLANHTFHANSLKSMVPEMSWSVAKMLEKWESYVGKEIDVYAEFGKLTTEIISRTAFGSSYNDGKNIFEMVAKLTAVTVRNVYKVRVPVISLLVRSEDEVEAKKLEEGIKSSILERVAKRVIDAKSNGNLEEFGHDYLGQLVKLNHESDVKKRITTEHMIDEIKTIYGAGHLTTTTLLAWCVVLLGTNTQWQDKAREEVNATFGSNTPDSDGIARLKIMNMIINECLRLYPPVITMARKVGKETKLGELCLPPKMDIFISVLALHHSPQIWGDDVHLFKPERFAQGVAKATNNNSAAFIPFGAGTRTCVGLNFTTNEAKIALSMILQKYKFTLSPNYVHFPADAFLLTPKNGVQVILEKI